MRCKALQYIALQRIVENKGFTKASSDMLSNIEQLQSNIIKHFTSYNSYYVNFCKLQAVIGRKQWIYESGYNVW